MYDIRYIITKNNDIIIFDIFKKNVVQFFILLFLINLITIPLFFYNNYEYIYNYLSRNSDINYFYNYINNRDIIKYNKLLKDKCMICHEKKLNVKLECNHLYHFKCISKWIKQKQKCPFM